MKFIILFLTVGFVYGSLKSLFKLESDKEIFDKIIKEKKITKKASITGSYSAMIITLIYYACCTSIINSGMFALVTCLCALQCIYNTNNLITYLENDKVNYMFQSKLYKIISMIIDVSYYGFVIYNIITHW